jgi:hypothetical protein
MVKIMEHWSDSVPLQITAAAALVLLRWLQTGGAERPESAGPAERQGLADLLTALEMTVAKGTEDELREARSELLKSAGDWTRD